MLARIWLGVAQRAFTTSSILSVSTTPALGKGHSKWQNIKATKGKNDMLKSKATNLLLRKVRSAVTRGGFDMKLNRELAGLELEFKTQGLSLDAFKSYIQRLKDRPEVEVIFDVIGPGNTFFIIQTETDNRKAMEGTIRKYFNKVGGFRLATDSSGVRSWFDAKGVITLNTMKDGKAMKLDQVEELCIELDCEEASLIEDDGQKFEILCDSKKLSTVEAELTRLGFSVEGADTEFRALHPVSVQKDDATKIEKFYEMIQEDESIKQVFDNIEPAAAAASATA